MSKAAPSVTPARKRLLPRLVLMVFSDCGGQTIARMEMPK
ncbi:hypothetical protein GGR38_002990 [Novosphingobium sediminicola]|uniref:Uncharacterized protein n=1 Tax=Novosphingobium sediminicola TaxID=563162 RepID=A0A7W6CKB7_9SPHN|nr:hypothetical protein [Novosphingobium sediminicola]